MAASIADTLTDLDALLADLQTSVPQRTSVPQQNNYNHGYSQHHNHVNYTTPPQHHQSTTTSSPSSVYANGEVATSQRPPGDGGQMYYQESKEEVRTESRSAGPTIKSSNELDTLLNELNHTRYTSIEDRAAAATAGGGSSARPTVQSLLSELNSVSSNSHQHSRTHEPETHNTAVLTASTATRDLDDLMAELSDFKDDDHTWLSGVEDQIINDSKRAQQQNNSSSISSKSISSKTKSTSSSLSGGGAKPPTTPPPKTPPPSHGKLPGTPPPRPPTPKTGGGKCTPPPRPPAPSESVVLPLTLPCPEVPPPIPPPPSAPHMTCSSPSSTMKRASGTNTPEPYERPDSGGPVKRNDAAYRWVMDEVKYEITYPPQEEPPAIPEYLNKTDTYAKPEKTKSPSPPQPPPPPAPQKEPSPAPVNELDCMLGSLASHMTEQGVKTTQKGCCCACDKPIVGQVITALGKTWHPEHFTCAHCSQELGSKNFFEREGRPYCEACYHDLFSPRCAYCDGSILDKCVTALDKNWHPEHFFCAQCGNTFGEEGFHEKDGKAYCREDYYRMFAPKCGGCNSPIMENYISALNAQWHPECFVCRDCRQPFSGGSFFDHEGMPYCETHYHAKRGSLCAGCHKPITGRCITAMFRKYHPEHFTCSYCMRQLNKGTFKEQNDKPYCHSCFEKLYG